MTDIVKMTFDEQRAIENLRMRLKEVLSPEMYRDSLLFYRFLKARDFDLEKAEIMLRKHLKWRKALQVDSMLEELKPKEVYQKHFAPQLIGFDKMGDIIVYFPSGNLDSRDIMKCIKMNDFQKHNTYAMEQFIHLLNKESEKKGRRNYQSIYVFNLDQLTFANATSKSSIEIMVGAFHILQENYPEHLKTAFIINAPAYYIIIYSILKKMMSSAMVQKFHVFGRNGWKEELLKLIDARVLPACLGGSRTDPDGNPFCLTFMHHGGKISPKYHLKNDERWFKDMSLVKKTTVLPRSKNTVAVDVKQYGSWIQWEFECKSKDIEFGLFLQDNEQEIEVLPMYRFSTSDGTETGSYKTESVGKYLIIFDNTYSWLSSKEVHYIINVVNPDS